MKTFSGMSDQEVREETTKLKTKLDKLLGGGVFASIRAQWTLAKYQNMVEECVRRGISLGS